MTIRARSLNIRHVDAGSCNGCEQELTALTSRDYDIQQYGLDIVASPRHADALVATGPITDTMVRPLRRVWDAIPAPKICVAFGDCAAGHGVFQEAYGTHGGLAQPDFVVRGCPPEPGTALQAILEWVAAHPLSHGTTRPAMKERRPLTDNS